MKKIIFNAENTVAGRTASMAAKELLKGNVVNIVNADKAIINGNTKYTIEKFKEKINRGDPYAGPFYPKTPERILKRIVRGMLPYKKPLGRKAYKTLRVYPNVPKELEGKEFIVVKSQPGRKKMNLEKLATKLK